MNFKNLKVGEKLSETQYYSVEKIVGNKVQLKNDHGDSIVVDDGYVNKCLTSASEVVETKTINKTEAANLFIGAPSVVLTVNFNKQVKLEDVAKEVMAKVGDAKIGEIEKAVKAGLKKAINGEERTMIGRHFGDINELGRVAFIDMEVERDTTKDYDNRQRQVDPRHINWMIIRGIKYTVK